MCHGIMPIPSTVVQAATGADVIYSKAYERGVLYAVYFKSENRKRHETVENSIVHLDAMLKEKNRTAATHFTSLMETGKVKSFSGLERQDDIHFCEIFNVHAPKLFGGKQYQLQQNATMRAIEHDPSDEGYELIIQKLLFEKEAPLEDADEV